jgi:protein-disulfide isomerase
VSWEVRPFLIFPSDPGIFLLLQCQAPAHFFTVSDELFATQDAWTGRIMANAKRLQGIAQHEQVGAVVRAAGVERLFRERGMSEARIASCLADQAALQRLGEQQQRHIDAGVQGTPTFFINGRHVDAADWASLEPLLRAP